MSFILQLWFGMNSNWINHVKHRKFTMLEILVNRFKGLCREFWNVDAHLQISVSSNKYQRFSLWSLLFYYIQSMLSLLTRVLVIEWKFIVLLGLNVDEIKRRKNRKKLWFFQTLTNDPPSWSSHISHNTKYDDTLSLLLLWIDLAMTYAPWQSTLFLMLIYSQPSNHILYYTQLFLRHESIFNQWFSGRKKEEEAKQK